MDIDTVELVKVVNTLVGDNQDLRRQVESLAKQNMKQARAMRGARRVLAKVVEWKEDDGAIYDENDRLERSANNAISKLDKATIGSL